MERFDYLVSSEWMSFPSYCRFGVCNYLETMGGLPPGNTFFTGPNPPSSIHIPPPAKSASVIFENRTLMTVFTTILSHLLSPWKTVLQRLLDVGPGFLRFFYLSRCWHHIAFQMFPEECILLAVVSAAGQHVSHFIPKLALIPAAFNRALWLFHPLLSLAGQNQSSMGRLTAGMLSVQFPPPRQNCDLLGVSFSVVWPLT